MSIIAVILVLGTAYDYLYKGPNPSALIKSFSVPANAAKLFHISTEKKKQNIDCLNGIRVISMFWVVYCHEFMSVIGIPKINWIDMFKVSFQCCWKVVRKWSYNISSEIYIINFFITL